MGGEVVDAFVGGLGFVLVSFEGRCWDHFVDCSRVGEGEGFVLFWPVSLCDRKYLAASKNEGSLGNIRNRQWKHSRLVTES